MTTGKQNRDWHLEPLANIFDDHIFPFMKETYKIFDLVHLQLPSNPNPETTRAHTCQINT